VQDHRQGIRTSLARALRFNGFTIWAILSSLADFDAEESQELTEKVRQYIDQLDEDSLHTDVLSYITTDNPKAKPAIDTKTTGDEASNLSTQPKRRRAKTQFEDKKNMHFETLTELKNKDCEELLVPDANSHHQEQKTRPLMTEQEFVKDTVNKSPMKDIAKVGLCYAFLYG
jgi:hypothetical protein